MNGRLVDLKRLSVHDGPGIRTTLFLKGCPLSCRWCHNPESISPEPEIGFHAQKCLSCGQCAEVCPAGAHLLLEGAHTFDRTLCTACGSCVDACLPGALEYYGKEMSVEQACAAVLEDRTFYIQSGGGCTLSGGEPLWQAQFCAEVFAQLHTEGVHCALDTSGAVPWESFELVLPGTDMFLFDLKHTSERLHREHVGGTNRQSLENLVRLSTCGVPIEVRVPLIPGFNDDDDALTAMGALLSSLPNVVGIKVLPYHLARSKYQLLGRCYPMPEVPLPAATAVARATCLLRG